MHESAVGIACKYFYLFFVKKVVEKKINELRQALILGEESGWVKNFNPEDHLKSIKSRYTTK